MSKAGRDCYAIAWTLETRDVENERKERLGPQLKEAGKI